MKPRLCDHERERRRVAGVRRYEPADIEIPPWPRSRDVTEPNSAPARRMRRRPPRLRPPLAGRAGVRCVGVCDGACLGRARCLRLRRRARRRHIVGGSVVTMTDRLAQRAKNHRDFSKIRIVNGRIHYFLYQQDGTKQAMSAENTLSNRLWVSWAQIHDSPTTGKKQNA